MILQIPTFPAGLLPGAHAALAWIFLRPLPIDHPWLDRHWLVLVLPLVLAIAIVYKAIKLDDMSRLPWQVARLTGTILGFMALAAAALWLLSELV